MWKSIIILCYTLHSILAKRQQNDDGFISSSGSGFSNIPLEHAFGLDSEFTSRGNIVVKTTRFSTTATLDASVDLDENSMDRLEQLAREDGLYRIRSMTGDDKYVSTYVKACYLLGSRLQEHITVSLDHDNNLIALGLSASSTCATSANLLDSNTLNTSIVIQQQVAGAIPDTQTYAKRIEEEKAKQTGTGGEGDENKSFFAKYWMYILPVVLILMLSSAQEPPAEGGAE